MTPTHALRPAEAATVLGERTRVVNALESVRVAARPSATTTRCIARVAELLRSRLTWPPVEDTPASEEAACLAFTEQWVVDVSSMSEELVAAVRSELGDAGLKRFVHELLAFEQRIRLDLAWRQLGYLPGSDAAATSTALLGDERVGDTRLTDALSEWQAAVVCLDTVDPITTELVRLRCASYHDCHT